MKIGIPKGLLYYKYNPFMLTFFSELGCDIITSPDTNKEILDNGVKYCVDEACLPIKIFHGHVFSIREKCDVMLIPRIMQLSKREYICPKFCGLPEMILNNISDMPEVITEPIYAINRKSLFSWALHAGKMITNDKLKIKQAFETAIVMQNKYKTEIINKCYGINVALAGHPYNVNDSYVNMNIVKKLNHLGIGVVTEDNINIVRNDINDKVIKNLYKKPFWTFLKNNYSFCLNSLNDIKIDGIIYISSFNCGIDSVTIELIKYETGEFPFLTIKIDEQTGEAGLNTRIEAFADLLERRKYNEINIPALR